MASGLNMSHGEMSSFVSFPLFSFTLVRQLRNFEFKGHENTLIFLEKKMISDLIYPIKQCLICLSFVV